MNLNKVLLLGRLTIDPQLRSTPSGQSVASFGLATNRYWTDKGGQKQEATEFHNIVVWGKMAETAAKFLKKGGLALIEGRLQTRNWEDKQGQTRRTTEIIAEGLQLGPKLMQSKESTPSQSIREDIPVVDIGDNEAGGKDEIDPKDLPF